MDFRHALKCLYEGYAVTLPEWEGYWFVDKGLIKVRTKDGKYLDTPWIKDFCERTDWIKVEPKL